MIIFLYYKLRGLVILGGGDIKYISVIVLFFNIKVALLTLFIASVISIPFFFFKRNKELLMPFGPFLVTAILIILLFPEPISNLFFSLYKVSL
jgi:prepilin signal peptidase PulO-like enzyme (type II secretory pathway)